MKTSDQIINQIEKLIDQIDYKTANVTIATNDRTITIEKTKSDKKVPMGFIKGET